MKTETMACANCASYLRCLMEKETEVDELLKQVSDIQSSLQQQREQNTSMLIERESLAQTVKTLRQEITKNQIKLLRREMDFRAERNARRKLLQWVREQEKESSSRDGEEQPSVFWVNKFKTVSLGQGPEECDDRQVFSDSDTEDLVPRSPQSFPGMKHYGYSRLRQLKSLPLPQVPSSPQPTKLQESGSTLKQQTSRQELIAAPTQSSTPAIQTATPSSEIPTTNTPPKSIHLNDTKHLLPNSEQPNFVFPDRDCQLAADPRAKKNHHFVEPATSGSPKTNLLSKTLTIRCLTPSQDCQAAIPRAAYTSSPQLSACSSCT